MALQTDPITCTVTPPSTDPDGDPIQYVYNWYCIQGCAGQIVNVPTVTYTTTSPSFTISSAYTARGQIWTCKVYAQDPYSAESGIGEGIIHITWSVPPTCSVEDAGGKAGEDIQIKVDAYNFLPGAGDATILINTSDGGHEQCSFPPPLSPNTGGCSVNHKYSSEGTYTVSAHSGPVTICTPGKVDINGVACSCNWVPGECGSNGCNASTEHGEVWTCNIADCQAPPESSPRCASDMTCGGGGPAPCSCHWQPYGCGTNGCAASNHSEVWTCNIANCLPAPVPSPKCIPDPTCGIYSGDFVPPTLENFQDDKGVQLSDVVFDDNSTLTNPATKVEWRFNLTSLSSGCLIASPLSPTPPFSKQLLPDDPAESVGSLTLKANVGSICEVVINATAVPDPSVTRTKTFTYLALAQPPICPTCEVFEIPAVMQPIGMYSTSLADAQAAYTSADDAVKSLDSKCPAICSQNAKDKLQEAKNNRYAAQQYLTACKNPGGKTACKMSQYYSSKARALAQEGLSLG